MGFLTKQDGTVYNTDSKGDGEVYQRDPEKIQDLRSKIDFKTQQRQSDNDVYKKSFIDEYGDQEEVDDQDPYHTLARRGEKLRGYGNSYTHPRHLNEMGISMNTPDLKHGEINSFKDMDKVLDHEELLRVLDEKSGGRTISTGTSITKNQLDIIRANFEEAEEKGIPMRAKITSISRKHYKNFNDFYAAARIQDPDLDNADPDNKEFNSHIGNLSENE